MYDQSGVLIAAVLFVSMVAAIEAGYRLGRRVEPLASDSSRAHLNAVQSSLLGILALLLGFTFSLSLQRFDSRSQAVVAEANAIGTTYLRSQLLPDSLRGRVGQALRDYLDLRVKSDALSIVNRAEIEPLLAQQSRALDSLWRDALQAVDEDPRAVTSGLFVQALNEMIDSHARRNAEIERHVPEPVLFLLFGAFLLTGVIVGYASGVAGRRTSFVIYMMVTLIVLLVFAIIDLDRPRRGLIEVSQKSLLDLQASISVDRAP